MAPPDATDSPLPAGPPAGAGLSGFLKPTPGRIAALVAFLAACGGAWAAVDRFKASRPADVQLRLSCNTRKVVLSAWNQGGHPATLDTPTFQMVSQSRWRDLQLHEVVLDAVDSPVTDANRELVRGGPIRTYPYNESLYQRPEAEGGLCGFLVSVPVTTDQGRVTRVWACRCSPNPS
jgi:hypothetical protein